MKNWFLKNLIGQAIEGCNGYNCYEYFGEERWHPQSLVERNRSLPQVRYILVSYIILVVYEEKSVYQDFKISFAENPPDFYYDCTVDFNQHCTVNGVIL